MTRLKLCRSNGGPTLRVLISAALLLASVATLRADDFWKRKPASQWTLAQALKLLRHSPWAHEKILPVTDLREEAAYSIPIGNKNCDPDALDVNGNCIQKRLELPVDSSRQQNPAPFIVPTRVVLIRWESAAPIAQAFARLDQLDARVAAEYQGRPPRLPDDSYVITVKMAESSQSNKDLLAAPAEEKSKWEATLKTKRGVVPSKETQYSGTGAGAAVHYFFPRTLDGSPLFGASSERVEFTLKVDQHLIIKSKFTVDPDFLR